MNDANATIFTAPAPSEPSAPPVAPSTHPPADTLVPRVLEEVIANTKTAIMPTAWSFLTPPPLVRQLTSAPQDLLNSLKQKFTDEELAQSRVALDRDCTLLLNPIFGQVGDKFLIRVDAADPSSRPRNAVSSRGALLSAVPPALLSSKIPRDPNESSPLALFVVASDDDLQLCHALGYATVPSSGLARMSGSQVRKYFPPRNNPVLKRKYWLVLVAWQMAQFDFTPPQEIMMVLEHLAAVSETYDLNPHELLAAWRPSPSVLGQVKNALRFRDVAQIKALVNRNLKAGCVSPLDIWFDFQELALRNDAYRGDISVMRRELLEKIRDGYGMPVKGEIRDRMNCLRQTARELLVDSFWNAAQNTDQPLERAVYCIGGELLEYILATSPLFRGGELLLKGGCPPPNFDVLDQEILFERMKILDSLVKMHRVINTNIS